MRSRKGDVVLQSAKRLFLEHGFESTSVDDIATGAGVSKATVYSNFAGKDALLAALVDDVTTESAAILIATMAPLDGAGPLEGRLRDTAGRLIRGVLRPEVLQLRRLAISEAMHAPAASAQLWERAPARSVALLTERFTCFAEAGLLDIPDAASAAQQFAYALIGPFQDRALLAPDQAISDGEIAAHIDATVSTFLRAHRRSGDSR